MKEDSSKIQVIVVARHFLYRLGAKTIISVIGIEPNLLEFNSYKTLYDYLNEYRSDGFLIIHDEVFTESKQQKMSDLKDLCPNLKVMLVVDQKSDTNDSVNEVCLENQKQVVEHFQNFFFEPEPASKTNDSDGLLSDREIEVLRSVATGYSNKEIADKLFISINTVITHRKNITDKLGIKTIAGLTVYAIMNNIIKPDESMQ